MVFDADVRQRNALFDLRSLAEVRQLQIALCKSDLGEASNSETQNKRLKRDCFHIVAVTLPRFSILRYQIIHSGSKQWIEYCDEPCPCRRLENTRTAARQCGV